jgi:hypothetical protein
VENLIFSIGEDGKLSVFDGISSVRRDCEGIDVESGVWDFFDSKGRPLKPVFHHPNLVKKFLFGFFTSITSSQKFDLVPDSSAAQPNLLLSLGDTTSLEKNDYFSDVASVRTYLQAINH